MSRRQNEGMIAIVGAGAMGAALAIHCARAGRPTTLLGTKFDDGVVAECSGGSPHPALGVPIPAGAEVVLYHDWARVLPHADLVVLGVSSAGLAEVIEEVGPQASPDAVLTIATKGWDEHTLRSPSEIVAEVLGDTRRLAVLGGPALASEIVAGALTAVVCAAASVDVARQVAKALRSPSLWVTITSDVVGVESAAAYKNVAAIGVGICEGLVEQFTENVYTHRFGNARAAIFSRGLADMARLTRARGGHPETIFGLAGAGDLYVTCLSGRNGALGRLLGSGATPERAQATIGSTVEGVSNSRTALAIADRLGIHLPTAIAVEAVLAGRMAPQAAISYLVHLAPRGRGWSEGGNFAPFTDASHDEGSGVP